MPDQSPTNPLTTLLNTTSAKDPGRACFLLHVRPEALDTDVNTRWQAEMQRYFVQPDGGTPTLLQQYFYLP